MQLDRSRARSAFDAYVRPYDPTNPRIALKIAHTHRVATLCERIAPDAEVDKDLAWLCGLVHDIGRFEQIRRFDTFNDAVSVAHAALGVEILFGTARQSRPLIRDFVEDDDADAVIRTAVATHSDYRLPAGLANTTRRVCDVLRDADKIDIIRVNGTCPIEDIYGVTAEDMALSPLSPEVVQTFYEHTTIPRGIRQYPADVLVGHLCFAWELVYERSKEILIEQGHLSRMLNRHFKNAQTQATFEHMARHLRLELSKD